MSLGRRHVVETVAASLTAEFGRGFDRRSLYRMMRLAEVFPDSEIVAALRPQLSWTHLRELIELLELTEGSLRVASYLTELPPRAVLERKLVESIEHARARAATQFRQNQDEAP